MKYLLQINNNTVNESDIRTIEKLPILGQEFLDENHTVQNLSCRQVDDETIPLITVHTKERNDEILDFFDDGTDEDSYPGQSSTF